MTSIHLEAEPPAHEGLRSCGHESSKVNVGARIITEDGVGKDGLGLRVEGLRP